jgi:four helix bundle protein
MSDFKRLVAWQRASDLSADLHSIFTARSTNSAPGFRSQVLRAADSIPATLAEGSAKRSRAEMKRFAEMAYASTKEVENHLLHARKLELLSVTAFEDLDRKRDVVAKLCYGLMRMEAHD